MKKGFAAFLIILPSLFSACSKNTESTQSLYVPTVSDTTSTATLDDLQQGRALYIKYCDACHAYYSPNSYTPTQWSSILTRMVPNTRMTSDEEALVKKYVTRGK